MTAEEIYQRWYDDDTNEDVLGVIRLAMAQARKAALEEAASLAEMVPTEQRLEVAAAIRLLAEEVGK